MNDVYLLEHVRADDEYGDDAKTIGIYRSEDSAKAAIQRLREQPGFRNHPNGWIVSRYSLDHDHWQEGFVDLSDKS